MGEFEARQAERALRRAERAEIGEMEARQALSDIFWATAAGIGLYAFVFFGMAIC